MLATMLQDFVCELEAQVEQWTHMNASAKRLCPVAVAAWKAPSTVSSIGGSKPRETCGTRYVAVFFFFLPPNFSPGRWDPFPQKVPRQPRQWIEPLPQLN